MENEVMYEVLELDVWGAKDDWSLNQSFHTKRFIPYSQTKTRRKLFKALRNLGYIIPAGSYTEELGVDTIEVYARNGMPIVFLETDVIPF